MPPALDTALTQQLEAIPIGQRIRATGALTTSGAMAGVGVRAGKRAAVAGYAERVWGHKGWTAGVRATWSR
jgi:hypothetical protein